MQQEQEKTHIKVQEKEQVIQTSTQLTKQLQDANDKIQFLEEKLQQTDLLQKDKVALEQK